MDFLKRLFGLGGGQPHDASGMYFYVRSHRCDEVVQVRIDRNNDLSLQDDFETYYARKIAVGTECFDRMEAEFYFDKNRRLTDKTVTGGVFVDYDDYVAYLEKKEAEESEADDAPAPEA